ncbi:MAG TPA: cache domain-containing protein, partial [Chloroflexota bacterium]|nr:cache domain-containing protein [Chloroflexota bacterium]
QEMLLGRVAALGAFTSVILLDPQGSVVATVPPGFSTAGFSFGDQQFFREARAVQSPVFSNVFQYDPTGLPVAAVAVPVRGKGAFSGVLVGGFSLARPEWARDLNLVRTPRGSVAYLVDGDGAVIYRPGSTAPGQTIRFDPVLWDLAGSGSSRGMVYRPDGSADEVVATYAPVGTTEWGLLVEEPWQPIVASVMPAQLAVAGLMGIGMIMALLALGFSLGRALRPLAALVEEGKRVAEGKQFRPLPEKGPSDLRALLRAVNQMVSRLEAQQETLRSYAVEVLKAQEEERLRLSRELHDGAVQDLVALAQRLELYRHSLQEGPAAAEERLQEVQALAQKGVVELRRMSNNLRPSVLEDLGLVPALQSVVRELAQQLPGARTNFEVVGQEVRLPLEMELAVFRIAQEALSNVRKHASSARRVSVALVFDDREVTLVVEDDGGGFQLLPSGALLQQGHLGLAGMAERARLFEGDLRVETAPEGSTTMILRLPRPTSSPTVN